MSSVDEARFDKWVAALGGYGSSRFAALHREALEFAEPGDYWQYLDMARQTDEEHARGAGRWLAEAVELANARRTVRRTEAAASAALQRATEIKLAADDLLSDPRLAIDPDFGTQAPVGRAEIDSELRTQMGLAGRAPSAYEAQLPPVADLARALGVRP